MRHSAQSSAFSMLEACARSKVPIKRHVRNIVRFWSKPAVHQPRGVWANFLAKVVGSLGEIG